MRKNILSLSIAQLVGGLGHAPSNGTAHVLQIPYYAPPSEGRVVKVRFRRAASSQDVFDFNLFLAPGDVWKPKPIKGEKANG